MRPERVQRLPTKRKKTIGKELTKWKNRDIKLSVDIPEDVMRPVGINSQLLITEEGCIVRGFAPLNVQGWKDVSQEKREEILKELRVQLSIISIIIIGWKLML